MANHVLSFPAQNEMEQSVTWLGRATAFHCRWSAAWEKGRLIFFLTSTMSFYWYDQTDPNSAEAGDCHANNPLQKNTSISLRTVQASLSKSYLPIPLSAFWAEATSSRPCISLRFSEAPSSLSTPPGDSFEQGPERWTVRHCPTAEWSLRSVDLSQWHETPPGLPWLKAGRSRKMVHMVAWCHSFVWV